MASSLDGRPQDSYCTLDQEPLLKCLNGILLFHWRNSKNSFRYHVLHRLWPLLKRGLSDSTLSNLELRDFDPGDVAPRVARIDFWIQAGNGLAVDLEASYDGDSRIDLTYRQQTLGLTVPVSVRRLRVTNLKVRLVLRDLREQFPFAGGLQISLLESPVLDWKVVGKSWLLHIPGLSWVIRNIIENSLVRRLLHPNRLSVPFVVGESMAGGMPVVTRQSLESVAMPRPEGVLRVRAVKARGLGPSHHRQLNPLHLASFARSVEDVSADPFVSVAVGKDVKKSRVLRHSLDPQWDFECDFIIEYCPKATVKVDVLHQEARGGQQALGKYTEKVDRVREEGIVEGWYESQEDHQGQAFLRFEWIPLAEERQQQGTANSGGGVACVLVGNLRSSEDKIRPTCHLEMQEGDESGVTQTTLKAMNSCRSWTFAEGKMFRLKCPGNETSTGLLIVKIFDDNTSRWVGARRFKLRKLLEDGLGGNYRLTDPKTKRKSLALSLTSKILYDSPLENRSNDSST